ncbi:MAG: hypothetical protein BWY79_01569 [Actinobacteria bacterium ADurb.Bin444]|nr:MAG: hypothetical protein BWY79_01569 [Actinobacteria bacterium ADurb.Bin444]
MGVAVAASFWVVEVSGRFTAVVTVTTVVTVVVSGCSALEVSVELELDTGVSRSSGT